MKTDVIKITSSGNNMELALAQAEKMAAFKELGTKDALSLRLLTEETMAMLRAVAGNVNGEFWIEDNDGVYELHLKADVQMSREKRKQLLSASTTGKNEASRGLMGKIRSFFDVADGEPVFMGVYTPGTVSESYDSLTWSMDSYREWLRQYMDEKREGAAQAWDEMEKSVVAHVADDVKIYIYNAAVEMTIIKKMG